jgi:hypothetical protein
VISEPELIEGGAGDEPRRPGPAERPPPDDAGVFRRGGRAPAPVPGQRRGPVGAAPENGRPEVAQVEDAQSDAQPEGGRPEGGRPAPGELVTAGGRDGSPAGPLRRARRPWIWVAVGALVASALWGGGLLAYGQYRESNPDTGGYRATKNLCLEAEFIGLTGMLGKPEGQESAGRDHEGAHWSDCTVSFGLPAAVDEAYSPIISLRYVLHRKSDPGPSFEALVEAENTFGAPTPRLTRIEGLGERAFAVDTGSGPTIHVLDGQAVFRIWAGPFGSGAGTGQPDLAVARQHAIEDLRELMTTLSGPAR